MLAIIYLRLFRTCGADPIVPNGSVSTVVGTENALQVASFDGGDIIGDYKLEQRLDYLGTTSNWFQEEHHGQKLLLAPTTKSQEAVVSETEQWTTFGYVTLAKEIRVNMSASCIRNGTYCLDQHIFRGGHGEVWRARQILKDGIIDSNNSFILKRMHVKGRPDIERCALREIFFGLKFQGVENVARYISYFNTDDDYWLVFKDEGISLQKLLYTITMSEVSAVMEPSLLWRKLRTSKGASSLRGIMQQVIASVAALHIRGVTHRDVKPSNILLNTEAVARILMADLSSAVSDDSISSGFYSSFGPLVAEETLQYAPPEVLLSIGTKSEIPFHSQNPYSYDSWSVGVVFLEMILGTSDVFTVDQRTSAMIAHRMKRSGADNKNISDAMLLAAFADFCIYRRQDQDSDTESSDLRNSRKDQSNLPAHSVYPQTSLGANTDTKSPVACSFDDSDTDINSDSGDAQLMGTSASLSENRNSRVSGNKKNREHSNRWHEHLHPLVTHSRGCGLEDLRQAILRRDPLGTGIQDRWAIDLIARLLRWEPEERISMVDAMDHAYFTGPYTSPADGSEHATREEAMSHLRGSVNTGASHTHSHMPAVRISTYGNQHTGDDFEMIAPDTIPHSDVDFDLIDDVEGNGVDDEGTGEVEGVDESGRLSFAADVITTTNFVCPKCGRNFPGDWAGCHHHVSVRKHGSRCLHGGGDGSDVIDDGMPSCLSDHSMLPIDEHSGWCELQGRRKYMEDMHSIVFEETYKLFAVFDGHSGAKAARFASKRLHGLFDLHLEKDESSQLPSAMPCSWHHQAERLGRINSDFLDPVTRMFNLSTGFTSAQDVSSIASCDELAVVHEDESPDRADKCYVGALLDIDITDDVDVNESIAGITVTHAISAMREAFLQTNMDLSTAMTTQDAAGTTASVAVLFRDHLLVANVGDSRILLCCGSQTTTASSGTDGDDVWIASSKPLQLTVDHTPNNTEERVAVEGRGGFVSTGEVSRVNGKLAVSRSLGDFALSSVISSEPDIAVLRLRHPSISSRMTATSNSRSDGTFFSPDSPSSFSSSSSSASSSSFSSSSSLQHSNATLPPSSSPVESPHNKHSISLDSSFCSSYRRQVMPADTAIRISNSLLPLFLILASDGLWDFVTGAEASEMVCEFLLTQISSRLSNLETIPGDVKKKGAGEGRFDSNSTNNTQSNRREVSAKRGRGHSLLLDSAMHDVARLLAVEAFVRGSMDNVGVCVVDLLPYII